MKLPWLRIGSLLGGLILLATAWAAWDDIKAKMPFADKEVVIELVADFYNPELGRLEGRYYSLLQIYCGLPPGRTRADMQIELNSLRGTINRYRSKLRLRPLPPLGCRR